MISDAQPYEILCGPAADVTEKVAMAVSGHETRSVFDRYNIVADDDLQEAMQRLAAYHAERRTARKGHLRYTQGTERGERSANSGLSPRRARGWLP